jgi:hypothetical protein
MKASLRREGLLDRITNLHRKKGGHEVPDEGGQEVADAAGANTSETEWDESPFREDVEAIRDETISSSGEQLLIGHGLRHIPERLRPLASRERPRRRFEGCFVHHPSRQLSGTREEEAAKADAGDVPRPISEAVLAEEDRRVVREPQRTTSRKEKTGRQAAPPGQPEEEELLQPQLWTDAGDVGRADGGGSRWGSHPGFQDWADLPRPRSNRRQSDGVELGRRLSSLRRHSSGQQQLGSSGSRVRLRADGGNGSRRRNGSTP